MLGKIKESTRTAQFGIRMRRPPPKFMWGRGAFQAYIKRAFTDER